MWSRQEKIHRNLSGSHCLSPSVFLLFIRLTTKKLSVDFGLCYIEPFYRHTYRQLRLANCRRILTPAEMDDGPDEENTKNIW